MELDGWCYGLYTTYNERAVRIQLTAAKAFDSCDSISTLDLRRYLSFNCAVLGFYHQVEIYLFVQ